MRDSKLTAISAPSARPGASSAARPDRPLMDAVPDNQQDRKAAPNGGSGVLFPLYRHHH